MPKYSKEYKAKLGNEAQEAVARLGSRILASVDLKISYQQLLNRLEWAGPVEKSEDIKDIWSEFKVTGDVVLRERLVIEYMPLVRNLANALHAKVPPSVSCDDMVSEGTLGLFEAIDTFDPGRGFKFETFAPLRIRGAMLDMIRHQDHVPRVARRRGKEVAALMEGGLDEEEAAESVGASASDLLVGRLKITSLNDILAVNAEGKESSRDNVQGPTVVHQGERRAARCESFEKFVRGLLFDEKVILYLYYYQGVTMNQIGTIMNISQSRVSQLHANAVAWLKQHREAEI